MAARNLADYQALLPEGLTIRLAASDEVTALAEMGQALYKHYFADLWTDAGFDNFVAGQFNISEIHNDLVSPQADWFLICHHGRDIGFAKIKFDQVVPNRGDVGLLIEKLYFEPDVTGRGLGQFVLGYLLNKGVIAQEPLAWLEVLSTNKRAQRAYEKQGFNPITQVPFATDKHELGFVIMARSLRE